MQSHSIRGHPQLNTWFLFLPSSNLPLLSAKSTISLKLYLLTVLLKAFKCRVNKTKILPLIKDIRHIHHLIAYYERHVKSYTTIINGIYCYFELFICPLSLIIILRLDLILLIALNKDAINITFFNYCSREIDKYQFSYLCFNLVKQKKVLKISFVNKVNIIMYKNYLPVLKIFTLVKKLLII